MSLYAEYVNERSDWSVLEADDGFLSWQKSGEFYILEEIYVRPTKRGEHLASSLLLQLEALAKGDDVKWILAVIWPSNRNASRVLMQALGNGWLLDHADVGKICIKKKVI